AHDRDPDDTPEVWRFLGRTSAITRGPPTFVDLCANLGSGVHRRPGTSSTSAAQAGSARARPSAVDRPQMAPRHLARGGGHPGVLHLVVRRAGPGPSPGGGLSLR